MTKNQSFIWKITLFYTALVLILQWSTGQKVTAWEPFSAAALVMYFITEGK